MIVILLAIPALAPQSTQASHSVPSTRYFWDPDDNGGVGPEPTVDAAGSFWSSSHLNRLADAVAEWKTDTRFDPTVVSTGNQKVYVDGRFPSCSPGGFGPNLAVTCISYQPRTYPGTNIGYYRIVDLDTYFDMENPDSPDWWVGSTLTPDVDRIHFAGVLVHELGHWILLNDLSGSTCVHTSTGWFTMCGTVTDLRLDTWRATTLASDDISAANVVYP